MFNVIYSKEFLEWLLLLDDDTFLKELRNLCKSYTSKNCDGFGNITFAKKQSLAKTIHKSYP